LIPIISNIRTTPIKTRMYTLQWTHSLSIGLSLSNNICYHSHFSLTCEPMSDSPFISEHCGANDW